MCVCVSLSPPYNCRITSSTPFTICVAILTASSISIPIPACADCSLCTLSNRDRCGSADVSLYGGERDIALMRVEEDDVVDAERRGVERVCEEEEDDDDDEEGGGGGEDDNGGEDEMEEEEEERRGVERDMEEEDEEDDDGERGG